MNRSVQLATLALIFFGWITYAQPEAQEVSWHEDKVSVAIDESKLSAVDDMMDRYVEEGFVSGLVVSIAYDGEVVYTKATGSKGANDEAPMEVDNLFRIYSMSKPITAVALMQLYEDGKFTLDTRLDELIPEFANLKVHNDEGLPTTPKTPATMLHLFTHTAGFGYIFGNHPVVQRIRSEGVLSSSDLNEFATKVGQIPLMLEPGTGFNYSLSSDIKGLVVERLSGLTFNKYLEKNIFEPLGMSDTFFSVPDDKIDRLLPNHNWNRAESKLVQVPLEERQNFQNVTFFSGGGGLVSTTHDYMTFARAIGNGGELGGVRILEESTVDLMRRDHLGDAISINAVTGQNPERRGRNAGGFGFGLGFGVNTAPSNANRSNGEYHWGGAAGTRFWIDPVERLIVVGMIQLMGSPHPLDRDLHRAVRSALVYEAVSGE